jgi:hypothetical protein
MKYALLVYEGGTAWDDLPAAEKRELHDPTAYAGFESGAAALLAHYRLRAPQHTTTIRLANGELSRTEGPTETREALSALFLLESDDAETVLSLAGTLPAIRLGGSVEVWPLIEPSPHRREGHERGHWARRQRAA